ncbi:MAG TPA: GNAT family N-acetyltransferase [Acidimicrobiales bacterium]|nr:GNAT family N-acetyltransferase [Acidimicrobiales bacterium]
MHPRTPFEPTFRVAVPADVDAIVALVESAYRGESSAAGWTTEAHLIDGQRTDATEVASLVGGPASLIILADVAGRLCGCCHIQRITPEAARFGMFAVDPDLQGGGIGRGLIVEACRTGVSWGAARLEMAVIRQRSDLIAWYGRLGFLPTGKTERFPYGDERFGRPRRPDLEFVVLSGPCDAALAG